LQSDAVSNNHWPVQDSDALDEAFDPVVGSEDPMYGNFDIILTHHFDRIAQPQATPLQPCTRRALSPYNRRVM